MLRLAETEPNAFTWLRMLYLHKLIYVNGVSDHPLKVDRIEQLVLNLQHNQKGYRIEPLRQSGVRTLSTCPPVMKENQDILSIEDIRLLVDSFYTKVRADEKLGPIFESRIGDNWGVHLDKMYRFWQTVLLQEHTYNGSPFPPHAQLPVDVTHFARWMELFTETVDGLFEGEKAKEAKWRAGKMAQMFLSKIEYYRENGLRSLL